MSYFVELAGNLISDIKKSHSLPNLVIKGFKENYSRSKMRYNLSVYQHRQQRNFPDILHHFFSVLRICTERETSRPIFLRCNKRGFCPHQPTERALVKVNCGLCVARFDGHFCALVSPALSHFSSQAWPLLLNLPGWPPSSTPNACALGSCLGFFSSPSKLSPRGAHL